MNNYRSTSNRFAHILELIILCGMVYFLFYLFYLFYSLFTVDYWDEDILDGKETRVTQAQIISHFYKKPEGCSKNNKKPSCDRRLYISVGFSVSGKYHTYEIMPEEHSKKPIHYIPEGANFPIHYAVSSPKLWLPVFMSDWDEISEHIEDVRELPPITEPIIQLDPVLQSKTKGSGFELVHISELLLKIPWAERFARTKAMIKGKYRDFGTPHYCSAASATLDGIPIAQDVGGGFRRRVAGKDLMFAIPDAKFGQTIKITLPCVDDRLRPLSARNFKIYFNARLPGGSEPVKLGVEDARLLE